MLRLNLRGAGPSRPLCRLSYHAGRSEDLQAVLAQMDGRLARHGLLLVGYSLGGNMLLKHLGEQGRRAQILAAASISAPIDLKATQLSMSRWRNKLYHDFLLRRMKDEALAQDATQTAAEREALPAIATIVEFDERIVAPRNGFQGADDYYARCSANQFLRHIRVPTLVIHALNDPWIPGRLLPRGRLAGQSSPEAGAAARRRPCRLSRLGRAGAGPRPVDERVLRRRPARQRALLSQRGAAFGKDSFRPASWSRVRAASSPRRIPWHSGNGAPRPPSEIDSIIDRPLLRPSL